MNEVAQPARPMTRWLLAPLAALAALLCAHLVGLDMGPLNPFMDRWAGIVLELGAALACALRAVMVRRERTAWALIAAAVTLWALGDAVGRALYHFDAEPPIPSVADILWLAFYPAAFAGILLLIRDRARNVGTAVWMDGLIAALAVAGLAAAVVLPAVGGGSGGDSATTNFIYVLCDSVLVSLVLVAFAVTGWGLDQTWVWLGGALTVFAFSDSLYVYEVAQRTYQSGGPLDAGWSLALLLVGLTAWRTAPLREGTGRLEAWRPIAFPIAFGLVALAVEVYDHFVNVSALSLALVSACLLAVLARLAATFADNQRMLRDSHQEARTDSLTGLANRRQLMTDLRATFTAPAPRRCVLLIFDLDGIKGFNDRVGHEAGDSLLARRGEALAQGLGAVGRAYRLGGDEFCVLVHDDRADPAAIDGLAGRALTEVGPEYRVSCSSGWAVVPDEAEDLSVALRLADRRMYAQKGRERGGERRARVRAASSDRRRRPVPIAAAQTAEWAYSPIALITRRFGRRPSNSQ
jgi:two-component system cell cycle response regulator